MKTNHVLTFYLVAMASLIVLALAFPDGFLAFVRRPELYLHAKFAHIVTVTLFFANVVIGTLWETRALLSRKPEIVRHTYQTVTWLDAVFTAPLILVAVTSGIMLATILGGVWQTGWISFAFTLFLLSGIFWLVADIPTQYKVKRHFRALAADARELPQPLARLLWLRMGINVASLVPLSVVFYLMVHKPDLPKITAWLASLWRMIA